MISATEIPEYRLPEPVHEKGEFPAMGEASCDCYSSAQVQAAFVAGFCAGLSAAKPKKPRTTKAEALRPDDVPESVWADFIALRKAKGAPLTETALKLIAKDAEKAGYTLAGALEICCARGWQAFRADWVATAKRAAGSLGGMSYGDRNGHFD